MRHILGFVPIGRAGDGAVPEVVGEGDGRESQLLRHADVIDGVTAVFGAGGEVGMDVEILFDYHGFSLLGR